MKGECKGSQSWTKEIFHFRDIYELMGKVEKLYRVLDLTFLFFFSFLDLEISCEMKFSFLWKNILTQ